jgi:hypothetical protein
MHFYFNLGTEITGIIKKKYTKESKPVDILTGLSTNPKKPRKRVFYFGIKNYIKMMHLRIFILLNLYSVLH